MADDHCIVVKRYNSDLSCCGIVLDSSNGIVLTVASLFTDLLPQIGSQSPLSADCPLLLQDDFASTSPKVEVVIQRSGQETFRTLQGRVVLLWRDEGLQRITELVFPSSEWKFESLSPTNSELKSTQRTTEGNENEEHQNEVGAHRSVLSEFALIHVESLKKYMSCRPINLSILATCGSPEKGDTVFVVGTPFGCECPPVFYNSVSKGIVSNLIGAKKELIITDARCIPGCEGCAMYVRSSQPGSLQQGLIPHGIILAPFCWRNGEWIGITLACSLQYLLHNLRKLLFSKFQSVSQEFQVLLGRLDLLAKLQCQPVSIDEQVEKQSQERNFHQVSLIACDILEKAFSSVVMVQCGRTWGSGIVMDAKQGLVATCSHVIRGYKDSIVVTGNENSTLSSSSVDSVCCVFPSGVCQIAQVLYATSEGFPLDFALLKVHPSPSLISLKSRLGTDAAQVKAYNLSDSLYRKGESVFVIGFPLFACHQHADPSVVSGVISNIAYANNQAVLLQSSAAVHCGASGGALVSMVTGELLGMVTSHTKDANMSSAFPHVNFSIPSDLLCKLVLAVKHGNVKNGLQALVSDHVENIWKLKRTVCESPLITSKL